MNLTQSMALRALLVANAFSVAPKQPNGASIRPAMGPQGPRLVNMDALLSQPSGRDEVLSRFCDAFVTAAPHVQAISSVPYGCQWFATMIADRLRLPLLIPSWVSDPNMGIVHGTAPFGTRVWLIDGDPDADDDSRLINAAALISSPRNMGCQVVGAAVVFERSGRTRSELSRHYPKASFEPLLKIDDALSALAHGLHVDLVHPTDAGHCLQLFRNTSPPPPRTPRPPSP